MKKIIILILIVAFSNNLYSQTTVNEKINQVKVFFQKHCQAESEKTVFFNKVERILELDGYQIPFLDVKVNYVFNDTYPEYSDYVHFECEYNNECMIDPTNKNAVGFYVPFASKDKSYQFINLIAELREFYE
ncbi:hypothetical protein [Flagellimonas profundi]|uniref:Uncharacterized protein n=1 Tax=Flagellimonas profundi TaxID=2915620 RepID=A0ABS3FCW1_9FLAO|nr:hypothetical protein [Allomuricauda profundi]MBO0340947.1 hypothetical protein [Allomuricauda profundi]